MLNTYEMQTCPYISLQTSTCLIRKSVFSEYVNQCIVRFFLRQSKKTSLHNIKFQYTILNSVTLIWKASSYK